MWEVLGNKIKRGSHYYYLAKCECGVVKEVRAEQLARDTTCGCRRIKNTTKHGLEKHPLYKVWWHIKDRCQNKNSKSYKNYGERGITVCCEWLEVEVFYNWAISNGWEKGLEIDRIDTNGNYSPSNCRFVKRLANARNKRNNITVEINGISKCLTEWLEIYNDVSYMKAYKRYKRGVIGMDTFR